MNAPVEDILSRIDRLSTEELNELEKTLTRRQGVGEDHRLPARQDENHAREPSGTWKRKALIIGLIAGALVVTIGIIIYLTSKETLAASDRKDEFGANVGYQIEQYQYRNRARLSFNIGAGSSLVYNLSPLLIDKIEQQSWMSNGRVIYLGLSVKPNSSSPASPARIIHDFHRGETYVYSPLNLGRTASSSDRWMSQAEFDGMLARFGQ
jgi:hypothetical protein